MDPNASSHSFLVGALLACVALAGGCVTQGTYDELVAQHAALQTQNTEMSEEMGAIRGENETLVAALAEKEQEFESMVETRDELVSALETEVAAGQIEIRNLVDGVSLNVSDELLFPSGGVTINDAGRDVLGRVGRQIGDDDSLVFVEGHTDDVRIGPTLRKRYPTNWELAAARASIVVRTLSEAGVDPKRLRAVSRGPFAPIASNETEDGRAKNRRTEIILRPLPAP